MRIVAIDASLTETGYATDDKAGIFVPAGSLGQGMARNDWIMRRVLELFEATGPIAGVHAKGFVAVIEGYSFGSQNRAHANGELGGLIRWAFWTRGIPYVDVPPKTLKKYATDNGNARKDQMLAEAVRRLGYTGHNHNEADALWLHALAKQAYGEPIVEVPKTRLVGINKVPWHSPVRKAAA